MFIPTYRLVYSRFVPPLRRTRHLLAAGVVSLAMVLSARGAAADDHDLLQLDLEALMNVRIKSAAGLTTIDFRRVPVAMTKLDRRDITQSGAVDLNRLLELYVPNAQFIDHHHLQPHLGFRGIISDREDKYLFQVNGRTMNNNLLLGADNERALPLLGDINMVKVVRGPVSATHGPGAIAGVIDLETYNGLTFQGDDIALRHGFVNRFTAVEARHGHKLSHTSGVFIYYGVANADGADSDYYIGKSYPAINGLPANVAGRPTPASHANLGEAGHDVLWHKLHLSYVTGPLEFWGRFVQDGGQDRPMREIYTMVRPAEVPVEEWTRGRQFRSRQLTGNMRFKRDLAPHWNLELAQSYDIWGFKDQRAGVYRLPIRHGREAEINSRAIAVWNPGDSFSLAFGGDYSHTRFQNPSYSDALDRAPVVTQRDWNVDLSSLMVESQWKLNPLWTTFLSVRTDKHTLSKWLRSPRATLVFTPTSRDTIKFMWGEAVRRGGDEELWAEWARNRTIPKPESLRSHEVSYERRWADNWSLNASAFHQQYRAIGWIPSLYYSSSIGRFDIAGGEMELSYKSGKTRVTLSEGYSKLVRSSVPPNRPASQAVTSQPYGYGDDLAEWAPFVTKFTLVHDLTARWAVSASVVHYSGFPGARDYADYAATFASPPSAVPLSDRGYTEPYGPNLYVNLGFEYHPSTRWTLRLDAYNLAALADETLSKRNYYFRLSEFSVQPASVALSLCHRF